MFAMSMFRPRHPVPGRILHAAGVFCLALSAVLVAPVAGQGFVTDVSNKGTVAAAFLEIGVGARSEAMGGAYASSEGRLEGIYWNPAGLAYMDGLGATFSHADWLADTDFDFFAIATPIPVFNAVVAGSFVALSVPEQAVRTVDSPEGTGEFYDAQDFAVTLSLSSRIMESFSVGVSGKYVSQRIWTEEGSALALDVGVYYRTPVPGLSIGSSVSNFGSDISLSGRNLTSVIDPDLTNRGIENIPVDLRTDANTLPQIFRFGMNYQSQIWQRTSIETAVNLMHPTGSTESMNVGAELGFNNFLFVRGGYQNAFERNSINGLTLGGGLDILLRSRNRLVLDYAWSDWGVLESANRFSLGIYL